MRAKSPGAVKMRAKSPTASSRSTHGEGATEAADAVVTSIHVPPPEEIQVALPRMTMAPAGSVSPTPAGPKQAEPGPTLSIRVPVTIFVAARDRDSGAILRTKTTPEFVPAFGEDLGRFVMEYQAVCPMLVVGVAIGNSLHVVRSTGEWRTPDHLLQDRGQGRHEDPALPVLAGPIVYRGIKVLVGRDETQIAIPGCTASVDELRRLAVATARCMGAPAGVEPTFSINPPSEFVVGSQDPIKKTIRMCANYEAMAKKAGRTNQVEKQQRLKEMWTALGEAVKRTDMWGETRHAPVPAAVPTAVPTPYDRVKDIIGSVQGDVPTRSEGVPKMIAKARQQEQAPAATTPVVHPPTTHVEQPPSTKEHHATVGDALTRLVTFMERSERRHQRQLRQMRKEVVPQTPPPKPSERRPKK